MQKAMHKFCFSRTLALLLIPLLASALLAATALHAAIAAQVETPGTWTGITTVAANVRSDPDTAASVVETLPVHIHVTVYATVAGQLVWGNINNWYLISGPGGPLRYIYAGLVTRSSSLNSGILGYATRKSIVVSLSQQRLYAFDNGKEVRTTLVTTGQPGLETPGGTYHVFSKLRATTFYSPVPSGSSSYYAPTYINYALGFREGGYFIHDATWRSDFGPHTNTRHYDHVYGWETGSHGCVNLPLNVMTWLYGWAPIGTTIRIVS